MRIAIINNLYEPFNRGGAEEIAKFQFKALTKTELKVITISLRPYGVSLKKIDNHYYLPSFFPKLGSIPKVFRLFWHLFDVFSFKNYFKIKKILKKEKIDTLITHNMTGFGKLILLFVSKEYKHLHVLHDISFLHPSGLMFYGKENILKSKQARFYQGINRYFTSNFGLVTSPSRWLLKIHEDNNFFLKAKKKVVNNPLDKKAVLFKRDKKDDESFVFLYVGGISRAKGVDVLLTAFLNLSKRYKNAKLVIIGPIVENNLLDKIKNSQSISYLGVLEHDLILENMKLADCLIVPSVCYENSPTVMYEAFSVGLPVISSKIGGATELIERFGGILFKPTNHRELLKKMKYALRNLVDIKKTNKSKQNFDDYGLERYIKEIRSMLNH